MHHTQIVAKAFLGLMVVYLSFHLFLSERSIPTYIQLSKVHDDLTVEIASLINDRDALQDRARRLRPATLDADLVEDYTIRMLGYGTPNSIILTQ